MQLVDSHCHLDFEAFDEDRHEVLKSAAALGVTDIVIPGVKQATWRRVVELCSKRTGLHFALGLHPLFIAEHRQAHLKELPQRIQELHPIAVGEIGLDFHDRDVDKSVQLKIFTAQLEIAQQYSLPVILHVRKAHDEALRLLREHGISGGVAHAFNGSSQQADKYIEMGFKLGFGGMLTFERSRKLRTLARRLPLDALVLETDAPDMAVARFRGGRNSPEYIPDVLNALASARNASPSEVAAATTRNALTVFGLDRGQGVQE